MGRASARLSKLIPMFAGAAEDTVASDRINVRICFILTSQLACRDWKDCGHDVGWEVCLLWRSSLPQEMEGGMKRVKGQPRHDLFGEEVGLVWMNEHLEAHQYIIVSLYLH